MLCFSADERFDATFHTNVLVNYSGSCQYIPPGRRQILFVGLNHAFITTINLLSQNSPKRTDSIVLEAGTDYDYGTDFLKNNIF